jgi:protoporphyrin/coproporphyrin ferrochelatase
LADTRYDAFLLLSFGGPQGPDEVLPFLRNVTAGRGIPDERLAEVAEHYHHFGGVSPITAQNEALLAALAAEFDRRGFALPTYFGNRNWHPFVADTARQLVADGHREVLVLATSATGSYSGCRQYREDLARAAEAARNLSGAAEAERNRSDATSAEPVIRFTKLRHYFDSPGFIEANADAVRTGLAQLPGDGVDTARLVFTAHSVPVSMNAAAGPFGGLYLEQHRATAALVAEAVREPGADFDLVWQSRSGPPQVPWLEPDINDHLRSLAEAGVRSVLVAPTGFVSDHLEVLWDLDNEAAATAAELGLDFVRAATAGTHPAFVSGLADLVAEQLTGAEPRLLSSLGICGWQCPDFCCPAPARRG